MRPHLEFASPAWSPWHAKDIDKLENVQRKFVRNVAGLQSTSYESKLIELNLLSLEDRRLYLDLMEVYKIIYGHVRISRDKIFELTGDTERRHTRGTDCPKNIVIKRSNLEIRRNFFSNRAAKSWNELPDDLKLCSKMSLFKSNLKSHLINICSVPDT